MHERYWGLRESPFRGLADPRYFFAGAVHDEALARLHFLVDGGRRLGLLLGAGGTGKSLLLELAARQLRRRSVRVAVASLAAGEPREWLWKLAADLGIDPDVRVETFVLWRDVLDRLREHRRQNEATALLLDDADDASPESAATLLRLLRADPLPEARLSVVLAVDAARASRLDPRLLDLSDLHVELEPWEADETAGYLSEAAARAGRAVRLFTDDAAARLHELGGGVPRRIRQMADLALAAGAAKRLPEIDAETIDEVFEELVCAASAR